MAVRLQRDEQQLNPAHPFVLHNPGLRHAAPAAALLCTCSWPIRPKADLPKMDGWMDGLTRIQLWVVCALRGMPHPLQGLSVRLACTPTDARLTPGPWQRKALFRKARHFEGLAETSTQLGLYGCVLGAHFLGLNTSPF